MMATNNQLPDGVKLDQLRSNWSTAYSEYGRAFRRVQLLDAADRGRLWEALRTSFPSYQILPDTNHVNYVKNNLLASIYTVTKSAQVSPTSDNDKDIVMRINVMLDYYWSLANVGDYQMQAGERAALTNLGITQVGWGNFITGSGKDVRYNDGPVLKNIDPTHFMYDPYAINFENASYCMTWDIMHESIIKSNPNYAKAFEGYLASSRTGTSAETVELLRDKPTNSTAQSQRGYHKLIIHWIRKDGKVYEIHTIDNAYVLHVKDIRPNCFPFALLYCNLPSGDLIGTSQAALIFSNSVAYNLMNSIVLTAEYKNQRPPVFVNMKSGINMATFLKHHNDADYAFIVQDDASRAVHYQQFPPPSPIIQQMQQSLSYDMQFITGIDGRYTGRDTGSIITTGGIESMLDQVTLIDAPKVKNYETYTKQLTQLMLDNLVEFGGKRKYFVKQKNGIDYESVEIDFNEAKDTIFDYEINISTELPKNKARLTQLAKALMEAQMQYAQSGQKVELITPEEYVMWQDLPNKEYMLERMSIQRSADYVAKVSEALTTFSELTKMGMPSEDAIDLTAMQMQSNETPGMGMPEIPQVAPEQELTF